MLALFHEVRVPNGAKAIELTIEPRECPATMAVAVAVPKLDAIAEEKQ